MSDKQRASPIAIRAITELSEMLAIEELQKVVWGCDDREVFPALALIPLVKVGAVLVGAFAGNELVGFVFGFPGIEHKELILHSDLLAVKASHRGQHLGERLKLAQREAALDGGIRKITWTFDPLQAVNAHLNFAKLGVTSDCYLIDFYGRTTSPLHSTGSDRLWVTWDLESERVKERLMHPRKSGVINNTSNLAPLVSVSAFGSPELHGVDASTDNLTIEIPGDINSMTRDDPQLALRWRAATRAAFKKAIAAGYVVSDATLQRSGARPIGRYILERTDKRSPLALTSTMN